MYKYLFDILLSILLDIFVEVGVVVMWTPACSIVGETRQIHTDYRVLWRKRDSTVTLSRKECLEPCIDRLLLLFWAHYIEDGPHLLCTGLL